MAMKYSMALILVFTLVSSALCEDKIPFTIVVEAWENYSEKDGTGMYHDLWRAAFEESEYVPQFKYQPFIRSLVTFNANEAEGIGGVYVHQLTNDYLIPKWHLGWGYLSVIASKENPSDSFDIKQLEGKRVAWVRGYEFDVAGCVTIDIKLTEVRTTEIGLKMLEAGRIDYLIDYVANKEGLAIFEDVNPDNFTIYSQVIKDAPYYFAVQNSKKGRDVVKLWDAKMSELYQSGELERLYQKYLSESYIHPQSK